jgi:hypothetical protein
MSPTISAFISRSGAALVCLLIVPFMFASDSVPGQQREALRMKVAVKDSSVVTMTLEDIDGRNRRAPADGTLLVTVTGGELLVGKEWKSSREFQIRKDETLPSVQIRSSAMLPEPVTISGTLNAPEYGKIGTTETLAIPADWGLLLLASIVGGILGSLKDIYKNSGGKVLWQQVAGALGLGVTVGVLVFGLGKLKFLWAAVGIETATAYPQTFLGLSTLIALIGIERVLDKVMNRKPETADFGKGLEGLVDRWAAGMVGQLRNELQDFFYKDHYLRDYPQLIERLEKEIVKIRYPTAPPALYEFLHDREEMVYRSSYRRNLTVVLKCVVRPDHLLWTEEDQYFYERNAADSADGAEVTPYIEEDLDPSWLTPDGQLKHRGFGGIVEEMKLTVGTEKLGFVTYRSVPNEEIMRRTDATHGVTAPPEIAVTLNPVPPSDEGCQWVLRFGYDFRFPKEFRDEESVQVIAFGKWRKILRDDVYFIRMERVTHQATVTCNFGQSLTVETLKYEWQSVRAATPSSRTVAHCDGWLLPGHGVCVAWYGTGSRMLDNGSK